MISVGVGSLLVVALSLAIPVAVLALECAIAVSAVPESIPEVGQVPKDVVILVPAHNEAAGIGVTLASIMAQVADPQQILVVADNCTDNTAAIARRHGVRVLERSDRERRGKSYALGFGVRHLSSVPPAAVIVVDADCTLAPGALATLARRAIDEQCPIMPRYLLSPLAAASPKAAVSALAFLVKNGVRPLGLAQLGLPCLIGGSGVVLPWAVLERVSVANDSLNEDFRLGIDAAIAGYPPRFAWEARIYGTLPRQDAIAIGQRRRWEQGHLALIFSAVPELLRAAMQQGRVELAALALELAVPPLSLLVTLWSGATLVAAVFAVWGLWLPLASLSAIGGVLIASVLLAWARFGRELVPLRLLVTIPGYVVWKIPLYLGFFGIGKRETQWLRTEREDG